MNRLVAACMCVCVLLAEAACIGEPFTAPEQHNVQPELATASEPRNNGFKNHIDRFTDAGTADVNSKSRIVDYNRAREIDWQIVELPEVRDDLPNAILIATCEGEPDEVAVPLNALDDRYCDSVQAIAYFAGEEGAYEVFATYTWSIADKSVANIYPLPGKEHKGVQRPAVYYDIFSSANPDKEPETTLTVCAEPLGGWDTADHPQLCRTLPLRAVVNLDAAWCFAGESFAADCDARIIEQDGRFLEVDGNPGTVYGREVTYYQGANFYKGILESSSFMSGDVFKAGTDQWLGYWEATRMSP